MHDKHFPGETPEYRAARDKLLEAERDLRERVETVAALRRTLPMGARVPEDYVFDEAPREPSDAELGDESPPKKVHLSELFATGTDTLVLYSYMYGPKMEKPCPMCTCFLDALEGQAAHLEQRVSLAIEVKRPIADLREVARSRGWRRFRLLSSSGNTFNRDYHGEDATGAQNTIIHVFVKRPDGVHHFYSCELNMLPAEKGQNHRHIDLMWPVWNVLDLTPGGRGTDWFPKLSY
jgi:predicted dithiol-disulfide oxidoreductase (DUF899 family)